MPARPLPIRSEVTAHAPAPVAQDPAMAEITELAARAPHLDFRAACKLAEPASPAALC